MPQELRVVRCFRCSKFQVDIVKKAIKWMCKVCGEKQSMTKEFFRGSGKECRIIVQELTLRSIATDEQEVKIVEDVLQNHIQLPEALSMATTNQFQYEPISSLGSTDPSNTEPSKWDSFVLKDDVEKFSDCLELEKAMANVSSTSFDRERVNVKSNTKSYVGGGMNKWSNFQLNSNVLIGDNSVETVNQSGRYKFSTKRSEKFLSPRTHEYFDDYSVIKNVNITQENSTTNNTFDHTNSYKHCRPLVDLHKKKPTKGEMFAPNLNSDCESSFVNSRFPIDETTNAMCNKRKHFDFSSTPLMNFGKRPNNGNSSVVGDNDNCSHVEKAKDTTLPETRSHSMPSKWAKFVMQSDETNATNDGPFVSF